MTSPQAKPDRMTQFLRTFNSICGAGLLIIFALTAFGPRGVAWWLLAPMTGCAVYVTLTRPAKPARVAPAEPPPPVREARHPDPVPGQKGKTCRICGMSDPERFRLKVGVRMWCGWPCHDTCVEWLEHGPKPGITEQPASPAPAASQKCKACYSRQGYIGDDGMCSPCRSSEILRMRADQARIAQARPPAGQSYLEPGTTTAPPGCLCLWRVTTGGYHVIHTPSYYGLTLPAPRRCEVHDPVRAPDIINMARIAEDLADQFRKALGVPHMQLGECHCDECGSPGW